MAGAGSSAAPLAKTLGLKDGQAAAFVRLPESLSHLADAALFRRIELAPDWRALPEGARDVIHLFTTSASDLRAALAVLCDLILPEGMIWVCWPGKGSSLPTDVTEEAIRAALGTDVLVDGKVCALDPVWSGLKLVVRAEARATHVNAGVTV